MRAVMLKLAALPAALWLLAGCTMSPQECDPSMDPGFLNKIGCTVSGSYAQRVEDKEANLQALQSENVRLQKINAMLEDERSLLSGSIEQRRAQYQALNQELSGLRSSLAAKNELNADLSAKLDDVQRQADELSKMPEDSSILERRQKLTELQETAAQLGI